MKKNLKVGDKVIINLSAEYNGDCNITEHMRGYDKREAEIVSITKAHSDGTNRYKLDVDNECFFYVDEWLKPVKKSKKKYKPKCGDKVELVFKYDSCGGLTGAVKGKKYYGVIRKDGAVEFYEGQGIDGWANSKGEMLCWHVSDLDVKMQLVEYEARFIVIPVDDWKRIYDVACDSWKKKLYEKIEPFAEAVIIDEEFAESMIKASSASQLTVVTDVLSSAGYKQAKTDEYFDFGDIHEFNLRSVSKPMFIRRGIASSNDMRDKEIGFGSDFDVIVVQDGFEITLTSGSYIKFKKK